VAINGDTALVGAPNDDNGANVDQGSAYVFERSGVSWIEKKRLTSGIGAAGDWFGFSVAINKYTEEIVVGAPFDDVDIDYTVTNANQGSVSIFSRSGASWIEQHRLTASDGSVGDGFGHSVAISLAPGTNQVAVMVGAPVDDILSMADRGSAYVFSATVTGNF
jgi:hypothetical protein